jgi:hypothetical protein
MQSWHTLIVERDLPANEDVENDAKAPDVDLRTGVELGVEKFGRSKVEGSTEG